MVKLKVMKLRSTTPIFKLTASRFVLFAAVVVMVVSTPISMMQQTAGAESIAQLNAKIDALKDQQGRNQAKANDLSAKANTLANQVAKLQNKQDKIQAQIDLSQAEYSKLKKEISETKRLIGNNQDALGETLASMYVDSSISPLEMLASSNNIGDYVDKQTYQSSINDQLSEAISKINKLKKELENQQQEVELALINQKNSRKDLASAKSEQQSLLNETKGKETQYKKLVNKSKGQIAALSAQAAEQMQQTVQGGSANVVSAGGSGGGYPSNCPVTLQYWPPAGMVVPVSPWTDKGNYGCSQCVSYVAWKIGQETGKYPSGWGDADTFASTAGGASAERAGFRVTTQPRENSIVFFPYGVNGAGPVGHVGYVDDGGVNGNTITVKQYNYNYTGHPDKWGKYSVVNFQHYPGMKYIYVAGH